MSGQIVGRALHRLKRTWWNLAVIPAMRRAGVEVGDKVQLQGWPIVSLAAGSRIAIGARCVLCSDGQATALGINHPVVLRTLRAGAEIVIGEDTGMSGGSICAAASVRIGAGCLLGANVTLADTDFHAVNAPNRRYNKNHDEIAFAPIVIEDNVFIGTGALVLKGVTIGKNSVIGAGAVVTRNVPQNAIAAGNPAKVIGFISAPPLKTSDQPGLRSIGRI